MIAEVSLRSHADHRRAEHRLRNALLEWLPAGRHRYFGTLATRLQVSHRLCGAKPSQNVLDDMVTPRRSIDGDPYGSEDCSLLLMLAAVGGSRRDSTMVVPNGSVGRATSFANRSSEY